MLISHYRKKGFPAGRRGEDIQPVACCPQTSRRPRQLLSYTSRLASESRSSAYPHKDLPRRVYGARDCSNGEHILSRGMGVCTGAIENRVLERRETKRGDRKTEK